jgi:DNA-binding NarL/FixJ family response regulator
MKQENCYSSLQVNNGVILLVEDHDIYREVVRTSLGRYLPGFEMLEADCLAAALPLLRSHRIDVLIVDMTLPDGSAVDLLEQSAPFIRHGGRVIVLSSHSSTDMLPVLSRSDVHGFVSKDQGLKVLAETVSEICRTAAPHGAEAALERAC